MSPHPTVIAEQAAVNDAVTALHNVALRDLNVLSDDDEKVSVISAALPDLFPTPADARHAAIRAAAHGDLTGTHPDHGRRYELSTEPVEGEVGAGILLLFLDILTHSAPSAIPDRAHARRFISNATSVPNDGGRGLARLLFLLA